MAFQVYPVRFDLLGRAKLCWTAGGDEIRTESIPGFDKLTVDSVASHTKTEENARLEKQVDVNLQRKQIKEKKEGKSHATTNASLQGAVKQTEAMAKIMDKTGAGKLEMQRKKLTRKVKKYKNNRFFVDVLKDVPMPKAGAPIEEWSECLDEIRSVLGSANAVEQLWNHLQRAVEMVVALNIARPAWFGGKNLHSPQNFALVMRQPETRMKLAKEIEELAIEYDDWLCQSAITRFLLGMLELSIQTATYNDLMSAKINLSNNRLRKPWPASWAPKSVHWPPRRRRRSILRRPRG